jgi:hypothetical protein
LRSRRGGTRREREHYGGGNCGNGASILRAVFVEQRAPLA